MTKLVKTREKTKKSNRNSKLKVKIEKSALFGVQGAGKASNQKSLH